MRANERGEMNTNILASGKCRKCKYTRIYDWTESDNNFCAAPCENCGAESFDIKREETK
jgi:predicted nucleic-acid-binding Zn-ribbon protein